MAFAASSVRLVLSCCCVSFKIIDAIYVTNVDVIFCLNSTSIDMKELSWVTGFYDTFEGEELRSRENGATLKIERPQRKHFSSK